MPNEPAQRVTVEFLEIESTLDRYPDCLVLLFETISLQSKPLLFGFRRAGPKAVS